MGIERVLRQAVGPNEVNLKFHRNRHLPEWRFLRFTMIVTVKAPICSVIRTASPPLGWCGQPPAVRAAPDEIIEKILYFVNIGIFSVPMRLIKKKTVTGQGGGFFF
jgi:hypothetical protein